MYEELVKRLRHCSEEHSGCGMCELSDTCILQTRLLLQSANAIEELNRKVEDFEAMREISPEAEYAINKHTDSLISKLDKLINDSEDKLR